MQRSEGSSNVVRKKRKYSPSPVLWPLAEYYVSQDAYSYWQGSPLEFRHMIKDYMVRHINQAVEVFVEDLPFLKISLPAKLGRGRSCELEFDDNLQEFLRSRKIVKVTVWNIEGFKGSLAPLSSKQIAHRTGREHDGGGFEVNLAYTFTQSALTTFSHEIGHTYFYDICKDPPECLISNSILETKKWFRQFEGMAFDLGREVLLPRKSFTRYVMDKGKHPSLSSFLEMHLELKISTDVLAQRLMKDLNLWRACVFWGRTSYRDTKILKKGLHGPHIIVRDRDKRKGGFATLNIKKELSDDNSSLRKTILNHAKEDEVERYEIDYHSRKCKLEIKSRKLSEKEKWFIALFYL